MTNLLTKKQLNDESKAVGSGFKKHKPKKPEEVKVVRSKSPVPDEVIPIPDDDSDSESAGSESAMNDLLDLNCVTCRQMDSSANNQLFECHLCHLLIHQLCHLPKISNETNLNSWVCSTCKGKDGKKEGSQQGSTKSTKSYESSSSSSSSSSHKKPSINIVSSADKKKAEAAKKKGKESSSSSSSRSRSSKK